MLTLHLFLPEGWMIDTARMNKADAAVPLLQHRSKPEIAVDEIDCVIAAGVRFGCVLADAAL